MTATLDEAGGRRGRVPAWAAAAGPPLTTPPNWANFDPLLDKRYRDTALGPHVVSFLAWKELGGTRPRTLDQYERDLARGCLMYPTKGIDEFGDQEMLQVAKTFKPKERRVRCAAYKSFFNWARRTRLKMVDPTDVLPVMKRQPKRVYDLFTAADVTALTGLPLIDGVLFQLMFATGARKGDCCTFQVKHWKRDGTVEMPWGSLEFIEGKGGKDRTVPATPELAHRLDELVTLEGLNRNDYLWWTRPGGGQFISRARPMGNASFARWWRQALDTAGVRYRNPHLTRHTFATNYLRNGGRLETLQIVLGHDSIKTTADLYSHLDMRDVARDMGLYEKSPDFTD